MSGFDIDKLKEALPFGFDTEATGDLTVENKTKDNDTTSEKTPQKREIKLPEVGQIIIINGEQYKVTYVNEGKKRFSCEPFPSKY